MLSGRVQHGRSARLVLCTDECASITAARPPIAAPASTSTPTALPCAVLCHAAGFWAVLRSGIAARKSPNDALLNFSFFEETPFGTPSYLGAAQQRLPVKKAKDLRAGEARLCSSERRRTRVLVQPYGTIEQHSWVRPRNRAPLWTWGPTVAGRRDLRSPQA